MKLRRDLGVTRQTAGLLSQRVRQAVMQGGELGAGPVEVGGACLGGTRENRPKSEREQPTGRRAAGKETLQGFVEDRAVPGATVRTDDAGACESMPFNRATVQHSRREYVRGDVRANGTEALRSMLPRARKGRAFRQLSPQHPDRCAQECAGRRNIREPDRTQAPRQGLERQRLTGRALIPDNGLSSEARTVAWAGAEACPARKAGFSTRRLGSRAPRTGVCSAGSAEGRTGTSRRSSGAAAGTAISRRSGRTPAVRAFAGDRIRRAETTMGKETASRAESHSCTLSGLRRLNRSEGWMAQ